MRATTETQRGFQTTRKIATLAMLSVSLAGCSDQLGLSPSSKTGPKHALEAVTTGAARQNVTTSGQFQLSKVADSDEISAGQALALADAYSQHLLP